MVQHAACELYTNENAFSLYRNEICSFVLGLARVKLNVFKNT